MAIGERIHYFRLLRGFTQKYLGKLLGFSDSQADVRIAQYENCLLYTSTLSSQPINLTFIVCDISVKTHRYK